MSTAPRTALLVGGSSEIGLAIVTEALSSGPGRVVLAGRESDHLTAAADALQTLGHDVLVTAYDASWAEDRTTAMVRKAGDALDGLDLVVVAVGSMGPASSTESTEQASGQNPLSESGLGELFQTNLVGPGLVCNAAADLLAESGGGTLVVLTSAAVSRTRLQILGYSSAKRGLDELVRGLGQRGRQHGVHTLVVRPGRVRTRMTESLPAVPLTTTPQAVARDVRRALAHDCPVAWSPRAMVLVCALLRATPTRLLPEALR